MTRFIISSVAIAGILFTAFMLVTDGSLSVVLQRYRNGLELVSTMGSGHDTITVLFFRSFGFPAEGLFVLMVSILAGLMYITNRIYAHQRLLGIGGGIAALAAIIGSAGWVQFWPDTWNRPATWTVPVIALTIAGIQLARMRSDIDWSMVRVAIVLLFIPFAVGLGSNTGMIRSAAQAAPIWSVASIMLVAAATQGSLLREILARLALVSVAVSGVVIAWALLHPQRQPAPLWSQQEWITVRGRERALLVDPATATYFRGLFTAVAMNGFVPGTPIIDVTGGMGAATIFILGGAPIGGPYMSGGYPGSISFVERVLGQVPRSDLERAWILTSPSGHAAIPLSVLTRLSLPFPHHYVETARATTGFMNEVQVLWRPVGSSQ